MKTEIDYKDQLTNEKLLTRFNNQFELVRYAIQLAENTIRSGRELDIWSESQNVSFLILAEIAANKEEFAQVPDYSAMQDSPRYDNNRSEPSWNDEVKSLKDDKKERKSSSGKSKSKAAK